MATTATPRGVLITGFGWVRLPESPGHLETWRTQVTSGLPESEYLGVYAALADVIADAMLTGQGVVSESDLPHMHWPDRGDQVLDAREIAAAQHMTERAVRRQLTALCRRGVLTRCRDDDSEESCGDGGDKARIAAPEAAARLAGPRRRRPPGWPRAAGQDAPPQSSRSVATDA